MTRRREFAVDGNGGLAGLGCIAWIMNYVYVERERGKRPYGRWKGKRKGDGRSLPRKEMVGVMHHFMIPCWYFGRFI